MKLSLYEYSDYKDFVRAWIGAAPGGGRGLRKKLAEAIGCQTPFVSHVLSGESHFSPEQAEACAGWMGLSERDSEYFLLLVLRARAATPALERLLGRQISRRRESQVQLKKRVGELANRDALTLEDQVIYYSSWMYAALHLAILNPALRTPEALANRFRLTRREVSRVLEFLSTHGLIGLGKDGRYKVLKPGLHLERRSPLIGTHHAHWRGRAVESVRAEPTRGLHYSGVISLSEQDYELVREKLAKLLEGVAAQVKNSADERLACLCFDWFEV